MSLLSNFHKISEWGVSTNYPNRHNRITKLLNQVCIVILGLVILSFFFQLIKHSIISGKILPHTWIMPFTFFPFALVLFLNRIHKHFWARLYFIVHNFFINLFWVFMMGDGNNIAFSFVIFPIPIALLFRGLKVQLLLVFSCFLGFVFCRWMTYNFEPVLASSSNINFEHISFGIWLLLSFLMLRIFTKEMTLAEEELLLKNKELDQFSRVASHDLKEPLRTISSFSSLILHKFHEKVSPDLDQYAHFINNASLRMGNLLDDLLIHTTIGKGQDNFSEVDLNTVLVHVIENLKTQIDLNKASININDLPVVMGLEGRLSQLFQNLINNAIKFRQENLTPEINIYSEADDLNNIIIVSDNGIGIPEHQIDKVFDSFHRVHSQDKYEGSGIGLATCKKIVEIHNGEISLSSEEGVGTAIKVSLPKSSNK